ncbi:MAG: hypothetical protein RJA81_604, partial [Planctomycetota bacterium]
MKIPSLVVVTASLYLCNITGDLSAQDKPRFENRLRNSTSPYLLQHAHNPVDWYPWGTEAFAKAKKENKPIFLSVGYAACHWCHVMERESFMDEEIAKILNNSFVCVKVDREERPDVDAVYMAALQVFMDGGGWPMNMMLTPEGKPFFGMTYLPPRDREGVEGFESLLIRVRDAWRDHRPELLKDAENLTSAARRLAAAESALFQRGPVPENLAELALKELADQFDPNYGGFGANSRNPKSPKFPEPTNLLFLLDLAGSKDFPKDSNLPAQAQAMALTTMDCIARGGIRDHLAGGIHRYSTDRYWTVPHFEKMLYDNALWLSVCARAFDLTKDPAWKQEVDTTIAFMSRTLLLKGGGFASSLDADTKGQEGLTYLWTKAELEELIGDQPRASLFRDIYGLKLAPNFENRDYVLAIQQRWPIVSQDAGLSQHEINNVLAPLKERLLAARGKRPQPTLDDKCLTSWNGLAVAGLADAFRLTGNTKALELAQNCANFLLTQHRQSDQLIHVSRAGSQSTDGPFLEDYAYLIQGLLHLYRATSEKSWLDKASDLAGEMIEKFSDTKNGGFFETVATAEDLFVRPRSLFDNAMPSSAGTATLVLAELAELTGKESFSNSAKASIASVSGFFSSSPDAVLSFIRASLKQSKTIEKLADANVKVSPTAEPSKKQKKEPVRMQVTQSTPLKVKAGEEIEIELLLDVDKNYHTYSNPSGSE